MAGLDFGDDCCVGVEAVEQDIAREKSFAYDALQHRFDESFLCFFDLVQVVNPCAFVVCDSEFDCEFDVPLGVRGADGR